VATKCAKRKLCVANDDEMNLENLMQNVEENRGELGKKDDRLSAERDGT